ncbi:MAG: hypothetical protein ACYTF0_09380, partial [Planctomycetota bacterium]
MNQRVGIAVAVAVLAAAVVGWNLQRFVGADRLERVDPHLELLPDPALARALSLGHTNTVAKLAWINSYDHFRYIADVRVDPDRGFRRLFNLLTGIDPLFEPYYLHGVTAIGGLLEDHHGELALLARGVQARPDRRSLWLNYVTCLAVFFDAEERMPAVLESALGQWAEAERALPDGDDSLPERWLSSLAGRSQRGLEQLPYWAMRLLQVDPKGVDGEAIQAVMREQLARYSSERLQQAAAWLPWPTVAGLCEPVLVERVCGRAGPGPADPWLATDGGYRLRRDPYGYAYDLSSGAVVSRGSQRSRLVRQIESCNAAIRGQVQAGGRWP